MLRRLALTILALLACLRSEAGLYERLMGLPGFENAKIEIHSFISALGEIERGKMTGTEVATLFNLNAAEQTEAAALIGQIVTPLESVSFGGFATLTNVGAAYDTTTTVFASQGLGLVRVQTAGITGAEFTVRVNKIGTGTQSWQLWNETDSSEIAVVDDAGAAGVKMLTVSVSLPGPLTAGLKTLRVRAKSTTAADDPLYLGASLLIRRIERMTSTELHEVLLLSEEPRKYTTVAELKARLRVP